MLDEVVNHLNTDNIRESKKPHGMIDNYGQSDWEYYKVFVQERSGEIYSLVLNITTDDNGRKVLYDINKIEKIGQAIKFATSQSDDRVSPSDDSVKEKMSERDSNGKILTSAQQEFFKDSKVRDKDGNLLVMYHGTPSGGFTTFRNGLNFFTPNKEYADMYQNPSKSSRVSGKTSTAPMTYSGYLNVKKPFTLDDSECLKIFIDEYVKGGWALGINPYQSDSAIKKQIADGISWEEADNLKEFFDENGYDYDGIVLNEGGYLGDNEVKYNGQSYATFSPNQFKNIDNENPTESDDIRFSERTEATDTRTLLANALETTAQNDIERKYIAEYKQDIQQMNEAQNQLADIRSEIRELTFAKGKRDTAKIKALNEEATKIANRINVYDKKLLRLESTKPLKNVLEKERTEARKRQSLQEDRCLSSTDRMQRKHRTKSVSSTAKELQPLPRTARGMPLLPRLRQ